MRGTVLKAKAIDDNGERNCCLIQFGERDFAMLTSPNDIVLQVGDVLKEENGTWRIEGSVAVQMGTFKLKSFDEALAEFEACN